ncbi:hypothetical protein SLEP1_g10607 [Rubroshorea leprosula]|uniref:Uncharacterized protein n=1 Tax=Rubroshorea leprosula TaxID=152421 RepID=A0AAV5I8L1_9ROSI|nr:hypothetical protein SLEP1_g10607 [Rubroshorea leprosula]
MQISPSTHSLVANHPLNSVHTQTNPLTPPLQFIISLTRCKETGKRHRKRLFDFAEKLGLPFEFHLVADKVGNLDLERLNVSKKEAIAVHWLQHSLYNVTGFDWLLQRLAPKLVTVVEQDLSLAGSFLGRFVKAIHYYSALFDSLGVSYGEESEEWHVVEQEGADEVNLKLNGMMTSILTKGLICHCR